MEKEAKEIYLNGMEKELKKLGYKIVPGDEDLYAKKVVEGAEIWISPEDKDGKLTDDLVVVVALDSIDAYAETENDIDEVAKKYKKALEEGKADLEKAKANAATK